MGFWNFEDFDGRTSKLVFAIEKLSRRWNILIDALPEAVTKVVIENEEVEYWENSLLKPLFGIIGRSTSWCKEQNQQLFNLWIWHKSKVFDCDFDGYSQASIYGEIWVWELTWLKTKSISQNNRTIRILEGRTKTAIFQTNWSSINSKFWIGALIQKMSRYLRRKMIWRSRWIKNIITFQSFGTIKILMQGSNSIISIFSPSTWVLYSMRTSIEKIKAVLTEKMVWKAI